MGGGVNPPEEGRGGGGVGGRTEEGVQETGLWVAGPGRVGPLLGRGECVDFSRCQWSHAATPSVLKGVHGFP